MARRARDYFERQFHWDKAFAPLGERIIGIERSGPSRKKGPP